MIRSLTIAAVAALIAAPALAAPSIKIDLTGKSNDQVQADIAVAVRKVCVNSTAHATFRHEALAACVKQTAAEASAQLAAAQRGANQVARN